MSSPSFIHDDFLLYSDEAAQLYHDYAVGQPIIDYHNHLSPSDLASDRRFDNITQAWLEGDHYKWRAMRTAGEPEQYITGEASDKEKFNAWSRTLPKTLRNPLYHWAHLELKRYFDIDVLLSEQTADEIYERATDLLRTSGYSSLNLLRKFDVRVVCTTDDPIDDLRHHQSLSGSDIKVLPTFRPDQALKIGSDHFIDYLYKLGEVCDRDIQTFDELSEALLQRMDYFDQHGCKLSDCGLSYIPHVSFTSSEIKTIFQKALTGRPISKEEREKYMKALLLRLCRAYRARGWVQQFHLGALRNNNHRLLTQLGPDTGFDSISDFPQAEGLSKLLDDLDVDDKLAKTILYNLNPADNAVFAAMAGNFNDGSIRGKVQYGAAWWFLDQKDGIIQQLDALSNMGLLSCFVGMLTDSRSLLSFPRHEYFRRILCNVLGSEIISGELPRDFDLIGKLVTDVCYSNSEQYFGF